MSVQGGLWNFDEHPVDQDFLAKVSWATAQHGPDGCDFYCRGSLGMFHRPFHTTEESWLERQPYISPRGDVLTWDGRLDNRDELIPQLQPHLPDDRTDVALVMAAYERWGTECFRKLLGDWSLALWNSHDRFLILAKDFMGLRHLYYELTYNRILWCTDLEPMVLQAGHPFEIKGEYIAGYFRAFPSAHLTPYVGIDSVPPGAFVQIKNGKASTYKHWKLDPGKKIRYRTDAEYEEHFRTVFMRAVRRRLRSDTPVLSELSGGMDSSSIVCVADAVIADEAAGTSRLDTVSYYDDEEPNWDERRYFLVVEEKRGKKGCHIDVSRLQDFLSLDGDRFCSVPGLSQGSLELHRKLHACMEARGNRVLLSGTGGDEITGGVPNPVPELADLLAQFRLAELIHKLKAWSIAKKRPWTHLVAEALGTFGLVKKLKDSFLLDARPRAPWFDDQFVKSNRNSFLGLDQNALSSHPLPSQNIFETTLAGLMNQFASYPPPLAGCYEERYPYVDRDLCDFFFCVPREQRVRPGQRRSLMRRSLSSVLPVEIIQRKRKAYVIRRPLAALREQWPDVEELFRQPLSEQLGYIHAKTFSQEVHAAIHGSNQHLLALERTLMLEEWLRSLYKWGVLKGSAPIDEAPWTPDLRSATEKLGANTLPSQ